MSDAQAKATEFFAVCRPPDAQWFIESALIPVLADYFRAYAAEQMACWEPGHTTEDGREKRVMCVQCADAYAERKAAKQTAGLRGVLDGLLAKLSRLERRLLSVPANDAEDIVVFRDELLALLVNPEGQP